MRKKQSGAARPLWSPIPSPYPYQALGERLTGLDHRPTPLSLSQCYPGGGGQAHKNGGVHPYVNILTAAQHATTTTPLASSTLVRSSQGQPRSGMKG